MGFLSKYSKVERIDLGDTYWVDIRPHLTAAQKAAAEDQIMSGATNGSVKVGAGAYTLEVAVQAIVDWNLTDDQDRPLPVRPLDARRVSVLLLPSFVADKVNAAVRAAEKRSSTDEADFPAASAPVPEEPAQ